MTGTETVEKYIANGYTSLVITNHFDGDRIGAPLTYRVRYDSYEEHVNKVYDAIDKIREGAAGRINIIDGVEMCGYHSSNHYLIFGMDRELALKKNVFSLGMRELRDHLNANGCIIIQAHPMRPGMTIIQPECLDGYEVYNGDLECLKYNEVAYRYALVAGEGKKILTVGNDHHLHEEPLRAAILTCEPIKDTKQLAAVLKSGAYRLHVQGEGYLPRV